MFASKCSEVKKRYNILASFQNGEQLTTEICTIEKKVDKILTTQYARESASDCIKIKQVGDLFDVESCVNSEINVQFD